MMLKAVIAGLIASIVMLVTAVIAWNVLITIDSMNNEVAKALHTTAKHNFQNAADSIFVNIAWIASFVIAGIMLVYLIHVRKR